MATILWPASPTLNQNYTFNSRTWIWDGSGWEKQASSSGALTGVFTLLSGPWIEVGGLFAFPETMANPPTLLTHI